MFPLKGSRANHCATPLLTLAAKAPTHGDGSGHAERLRDSVLNRVPRDEGILRVKSRPVLLPPPFHEGLEPSHLHSETPLTDGGSVRLSVPSECAQNLRRLLLLLATPARLTSY